MVALATFTSEVASPSFAKHPLWREPRSFDDAAASQNQSRTTLPPRFRTMHWISNARVTRPSQAVTGIAASFIEIATGASTERQGAAPDHREASLRALTGLLLRARSYAPDTIEELLHAISDAARFVAAIPDGAPRPVISGSDQGEVAFEWRLPTGRAIATFEGDGAFGYAMQRGGRFAPGAHEVNSPDQFPLDLQEYLTAGQ